MGACIRVSSPGQESPLQGLVCALHHQGPFTLGSDLISFSCRHLMIHKNSYSSTYSHLSPICNYPLRMLPKFVSMHYRYIVCLIYSWVRCISRNRVYLLHALLEWPTTVSFVLVSSAVPVLDDGSTEGLKSSVNTLRFQVSAGRGLLGRELSAITPLSLFIAALTPRVPWSVLFCFHSVPGSWQNHTSLLNLFAVDGVLISVISF